MKNKLSSLFSLKKLPFFGIVVLCLAMAIATFIEKKEGADYVYSQIYGSWWFSCLWGFLILLNIIGIIKGKLYKNRPVLCIHLSLILILSGAFCTKLSAEHGYIILNKNEFNNRMQMDKKAIFLPFEMQLDTFYISYYAGTNAPADYISHLSIKDKKTSDIIQGKVSMNNIFTYNNYRFYQASFEDDWQTSILSINHDIFGIPLTYAGYALFILSMIWFLFSPNNTFRKLLKNSLLKKTLIIVCGFIPSTCFSQVLTKDSLSVNKEQAEEFSQLWILYNDRVTPMTIFAQDFTLKLTGKKSFNYLNANQFLMGFLFFPDKWEQIALFEVKDNDLKKELNAETEKAALIDFYDSDGNYKLSKYWKDLNSNTPKSNQLKEIEKLNEKVQLIRMFHQGNLLQIYPQEIDISTSLSDYRQAITNNDAKKATEILQIIKDFQVENSGEILPSKQHRAIEIFYTKVNFASILFKVNLIFGLISLFLVFNLSDEKLKKVRNILFILLLFSFGIHTFSIALRTYIGGRLPFSNGFETMLLIAWCAMLSAILFGRKIPYLISFGYLISGCALLVAHLGMMNPQITPLVPVLASPLLSIHVSVIMIAYTLFAFITLNSFISLTQLLFNRKKEKKDILLKLEQNRIYNLICLYPSLLFLGAGIFIGAVWANVSWGRYWGWDPKEVWALITFLVYSLIIHSKSLKLFADPFFFHAYSLIAFSTVLMTYFGVNYFLGGLHSYAGEILFDSAFVYIILIALFLLGLLFFSYRKYKAFS